MDLCYAAPMSDDADAVIDRAPAGWDNRQLCPDGSCVGVIGESGMCTECGKIPTGEQLDPRIRGLRDDADVDSEVELHKAATSTPAPPDDWGDRQLCPDGACIGLIGQSGVCGECGRSADSGEYSDN